MRYGGIFAVIFNDVIWSTKAIYFKMADNQSIFKEKKT